MKENYNDKLIKQISEFLLINDVGGYGCPSIRHKCKDKEVRELLELATDIIISEIMDHIKVGDFACSDITCFADLHDYIDANCLGNMCDDHNEITGGNINYFDDVICIVQSVVNERIVGGEYRTRLPEYR